MRKGFTLIELLAVIVILAIIAIIAVPTISNVVSKARKGAAEASALNYIDAVEKYMILHDMNPTKYPYDIKGGTFNVASNTELSLIDLIIPKAKAEETIPSLNSFINVKGDKPKSGTITTNEKGKVTEADIVIKGYYVECTGSSCIGEKQKTTLTIDSESSIDLGVGDTVELVTHTNSNKTITWTSSDDTIATVNNGVVTGVKSGTVTITAKIDKVSAIVNINVINIDLTINGNATRDLFINDVLTLEITTNYNKPIKWISSDDTVATVNNGVVTGIKAGTATITAKQANTSKTVVVNVMKPGPTFIAAKSGETHKGIVYLNPKNFNDTCNQSNSSSTFGRKEGCMKWYVISDSGSTYKMLLDHNILKGTRLYYNRDNNCSECATTLLKSNTSGWQSTPRLISLAEINALTGVSQITYYSFGCSPNAWSTNYSSQTDTQKARQRSFHWLFDNLEGCTSYGCSVADNSAGVAYWTSTTAGNVDSAYFVQNEGMINSGQSHTPGWGGVRPVIEVNKSLFE